MVLKIAFNSGACNSAAIYTATRHVDGVISVSLTDESTENECENEEVRQIQIV